jgi:hypothetical protein
MKQRRYRAASPGTKAPTRSRNQIREAGLERGRHIGQRGGALGPLTAGQDLASVMNGIATEIR